MPLLSAQQIKLEVVTILGGGVHFEKLTCLFMLMHACHCIYLHVCLRVSVHVVACLSVSMLVYLCQLHSWELCGDL